MGKPQPQEENDRVTNLSSLGKLSPKQPWEGLSTNPILPSRFGPRRKNWQHQVLCEWTGRGAKIRRTKGPISEAVRS